MSKLAFSVLIQINWNQILIKLNSIMTKNYQSRSRIGEERQVFKQRRLRFDKNFSTVCLRKGGLTPWPALSQTFCHSKRYQDLTGLVWWWPPLVLSLFLNHSYLICFSLASVWAQSGIGRGRDRRLQPLCRTLLKINWYSKWRSIYECIQICNWIEISVRIAIKAMFAAIHQTIGCQTRRDSARRPLSGPLCDEGLTSAPRKRLPRMRAQTNGI